jgi:hypothetical protein
VQVVEQWNSANGAIYYGKDAELTGPDRESAEISMLSLHLLPSALVLVNTRLVDAVLREDDWAARMSDRDVRGLTPLFWSNVGLHGTFTLKVAEYSGAPMVACRRVRRGRTRQPERVRRVGRGRAAAAGRAGRRRVGPLGSRPEPSSTVAQIARPASSRTIRYSSGNCCSVTGWVRIERSAILSE